MTMPAEAVGQGISGYLLGSSPGFRVQGVGLGLYPQPSQPETEYVAPLFKGGGLFRALPPKSLFRRAYTSPAYSYVFQGSLRVPLFVENPIEIYLNLDSPGLVFSWVAVNEPYFGYHNN